MAEAVDCYTQFTITQIEAICRLRKIPITTSYVEMILALVAQDQAIEAERAAQREVDRRNGDGDGSKGCCRRCFEQWRACREVRGEGRNLTVAT